MYLSYLTYGVFMGLVIFGAILSLIDIFLSEPEPEPPKEPKTEPFDGDWEQVLREVQK